MRAEPAQPRGFGDACVVDGVVEAIGESGGLQRRVQFENDGD